MTRINTNVSSMIAQFNLQNANNQLQTSLTRLSTGLQINSGADNPAGLIESQTLGSEITSINASLTNAQQANDVVSTADAALAQVSNQLQSIRGLVQSAASSGTSSASEIAADQQQVDSSLQAIQQIAQTTIFGSQSLLNGSMAFKVDASGGSLGAFADPTDITVASFNPALESSTPGSDVSLAVTQAATQATSVITGDSSTSGVGLNNLSTNSTHASTTLLAANYAAGATTGLNFLSTGSTHTVSTIVGANYTGTTTGLNNLSTNSTRGTATIAGANYAAGATTGLNLLSSNSTHATATISGSDLAALTNSGSDTITLAITGNAGGPVDTAAVSLSDIQANSEALTQAINAVSSQTGVTASGSGAGGNITLTSAYVGTSSALTVAGTDSNSAEQTALTGAIGATTAGTTGAATQTTFTVTGNVGSKTVTLDNNDTVINGGVSSLATLINTVTADTGVTASVNSGGSLVLTSAAVGTTSQASLSIADGDGASADQSLVSNSQSQTAGTSGAATGTQFTVTGDLGSDEINVDNNDSIINGGASALATLINNVSSNTGVTAAVSGSGNLVLTSGYVGTGAKASLSATALDGTNDADTTLISNSQTTTAGTTDATATGTEFTITGNTGSAEVTVANNDSLINGGASSLVSQINGVTAKTGVIASLNSSGSIVLTSNDVGTTSEATITAAGTDGTADADTTLVANSQTATAGTAGTANTTTIELNGDLGQAIITVNNDAVINDSSALSDAINAVTSQTGITASTAGGQGANVTLTSQDYGSTAQVSAQAIAADNAGDVTLFNSTNTQATAAGKNVEGTVTTALGSGSFIGTGADFTYTDSNISLSGTTDPNQGTATANFNVSGGALFQLGPEVNYSNQVNVSLGSLDLATLGRDVNTTGNDGLSSLQTGGDNQLSSASLANAANIVDQAINQVATLSGQLGALQTNVLDSATSSLQANLEQVTSAQSNIMDADFASETANLTRAQILVQSGMSVLSIANSQPQNVLTLLQKIQ